VQDGYNSDALHGDLSQSQRDHVMKRFRSKNLQMLVATDVAARGLDVKDITHVIHYNLPDEASIYLHRSGRTGRAGKTGISVAIINMREKHTIREIEKKLKKQFERGKIPTGQQICEKQLLSRIDSWLAIDINHARIDPFLPLIVKKMEGLDREALIKLFVSVEFSRFLEYYRDAPDLNIQETDKSRTAFKENDGKFQRQSNYQKYTKFILSVGKKDGINPARLIAEINSATVDTPKIAIGKIEIMGSSSMIEVDGKFTPKILDIFKHVRINGKPVNVRVDEGNISKKTSNRGGGHFAGSSVPKNRESIVRKKWKSKEKTSPRQYV